jgi:CHAT domain-containing protein
MRGALSILLMLFVAGVFSCASGMAAPLGLLPTGTKEVDPFWLPAATSGSYADKLLGSEEDTGGLTVDDAMAVIDRSGANAGAGTEEAPSGSSSAPLSFRPPPRTIDDVTAILNQEKPDPAEHARLLSEVDRPPPAGAAPALMAEFYYKRGLADRRVGRDRQFLEDEKRACAFADQAVVDPVVKDRYLKQLSIAYADMGDMKGALDVQDVRLAASVPGPIRFSILFLKFFDAVNLGRLDTAHDTLNRALSLTRMRRGLRARVLDSRMLAQLALVEGRYADAEANARSGLAAIEGSDLLQNDEEGSFHNQLSAFHVQLARALMNQNRLLEAEAEVRTALLEDLQFYGRFARETADTVRVMSTILLAEGRYREAERLAATSRDILIALGHGSGSASLASSLSELAKAQSASGNSGAARVTFAELLRVIGDNSDLRHSRLDLNINYAVVMLLQTRSPDAIRAFQYLVKTYSSQFGERASQTAYAHGWLGVAYLNAGDEVHAQEQFAAALPVLLLQSDTAPDDQSGETPTDGERLLAIIGESYLSLLAEGPNGLSNTFVLADALRRKNVGRALGESAARVAVSDPALANLARHEQDAGKQIGALQAMLTHLLSLPSAQQDTGAATNLKVRIARLRTARARLQRAIELRAPAYADYLKPKPATLEQVRRSLRSGEAMVAFYLGRQHLFAWAVPYQGVPAFAVTKVGYREVANLILGLRRSLNPQAETVDQIPEFDVEQAYQLYRLLLQPVESGWRNAQTLIVVPHRILGALPLNLLVTVPTKPVSEGPIRFSAYRDVQFLARKLAVAQLPLAGTLATLRSLPVTSGSRVSFVGFGDPWFNAQEAREASGRAGSSELKTRGLPLAQMQRRGTPIRLRDAPVDKTGIYLSQLPRLPDTADEVRSIAAVLHADLSRDVFLGAAANVHTVRTINMADRRIVVFATHGLLPGDIVGLTQPALALSAPSVAHIDGDGLLTVDKILGLKLNADWVVLSACNTAAGSGAGTEAVSGLGRAFFYAGTRALLVSNWPVETNSAHMLTSDLFRRAATDPRLARAEALREAELALIDGPGAVDHATGRTEFSYAHPIFWAPFAVVGDGGTTAQ